MAKLTVENVANNITAFFIQILFGFVSSFLVLLIVDALIRSIALSMETKLIVTLILGGLEPILDNKKT